MTFYPIMRAYFILLNTFLNISIIFLNYDITAYLISMQSKTLIPMTIRH